MLVFTPQSWQIRLFRYRLVISVRNKLDYFSMQRFLSHMACSRLSVSANDWKSGRTISRVWEVPSLFLPDPARRWSRLSPARFFDRPHGPRAWNRLYHTEFDFLWLFIHLRPRKNVFHTLLFLFIPLKETQFGQALLGLLWLSLQYILTFISLFAKKVTIDFC